MNDNASGLFLEERRKKIYSILERNRRATITELTEGIEIGEATIRRDLIALEKKGLIKRTHGGAILADCALDESIIKLRETSNTDKKEAIAAAMAKSITDGEALFLDGGTTTQLVARAIKSKKNLVVITNSLNVASEIANTNGNTVLLTGGELRTVTNALIGPLATTCIKQFRADHTILGMSSLIPDEGFFTVNQYEAEIKRTMIGRGKKNTIVMDSTKINKVVFSFVCGFEQIDQLIIDDGVSPQIVEALEKQGVDIIVV